MDAPINNQTKTILIVEDEPNILRAISIMLKNEGFNVFTAQNGEEGVAFAEKHRPDLIVLDIIMPKMDGITMLKHIRDMNTDDWGKKVKVIVYTNLSYIERRQEAERVGINEFLVKSDVSLVGLAANIKKEAEAK